MNSEKLESEMPAIKQTQSSFIFVFPIEIDSTMPPNFVINWIKVVSMTYKENLYLSKHDK